MKITRPKIEDEIRKAKPLMQELIALGVDDDEEVVESAIEGETGLLECADQALYDLGNTEASIVALSQLIDTLATRKKRLEAKAEAYRLLAGRILEASGLTKMQRPGGTISFAKGQPKMIEVEGGVIPPEYWIEQEPKLDKRALKTALKDGLECTGAKLVEGEPQLRIKR